jgi:ParB family transcriptional regulator, chromosome partitioning protein
MELKHIELTRLSVSNANMRAKGKAGEIEAILPSVRARGVLVPLIVRANGTPDTYEIVAGKRRYQAALAVAGEGGDIDRLPCAVIEAGDDAAALEASLIENIARLDPDEVTRWETFTRLVREGITAADLALTFGLGELQIKRTLALGNLLPRIRRLYRSEALNASSVRHLTLASRAQQRDWLNLYDDPDQYAPSGMQLKAWLFGGASISTKAALFDLSSYEGAIVADLFGEDSYFGDAEMFWRAQDAAVEERAEQYRAQGWSEVVILRPGEQFCSWEHERRTKAKGGKVIIAIDHRGEVRFHEGYVTSKEARRLDSGEQSPKPVRPEVTSSLRDYIDLHRHAVVRNRLADAPSVALRVAVAHMIAGSPLWTVRVEPQRSRNEAVTESVEVSEAEARFDAKRRAILALLGFDAEAPSVVGGAARGEGVSDLLAKLLALDEAKVRDIMALVMAETLDARSDVIDTLGPHFEIDMARDWSPDATLFDLVRDRAVLNAMVSEVAGTTVAEANASATGKVQRLILRDCIEGNNGRAKVEGWVPRWMRFPPSSYTNRSGADA